MGIRIKQMPNFSRMKAEIQQQIIREMERVAVDNKEEVVTRTGRGLDYDGKPFARYSAKYARFKSDKGRNVSRPDLRLSGRMLQSIQHKVLIQGKKIVARIFPISNFEALKIRGNMRTREFFAISEKQKKDFRDRISNLFRRLK